MIPEAWESGLVLAIAALIVVCVEVWAWLTNRS